MGLTLLVGASTLEQTDHAVVVLVTGVLEHVRITAVDVLGVDGRKQCGIHARIVDGVGVFDGVEAGAPEPLDHR